MYYSDGCYTALTKLGFSSQLLAKLSPAAKSHLMNAGVGAAGGAVLGGENNRMSGALGGAALGLGAGHVMGQAAEGAAAKKGLSSVEQAAEGAATHRPTGESMRAIEKTKAPTQAAETAPAQSTRATDPFIDMLPQSLAPQSLPPVPKAPPVPKNLGPAVPGMSMPMREPSAQPSIPSAPMSSAPAPTSGMRPTAAPDTTPAPMDIGTNSEWTRARAAVEPGTMPAPMDIGTNSEWARARAAVEPPPLPPAMSAPPTMPAPMDVGTNSEWARARSAVEPTMPPSTPPVEMGSMSPPISGMRPTAIPPNADRLRPSESASLDSLFARPAELPTSYPVPISAPPMKETRYMDPRWDEVADPWNPKNTSLIPPAKTGSVIPSRIFLPVTKLAMDPILARVLRTKLGFVNPNQALSHGLIGAGIGGVAGAIGGGEDHRLAGGLAGAITGGSLGALHGEYKGLPSAAEAKSVTAPAKSMAPPAPVKSMPPAASASMPPSMGSLSSGQTMPPSAGASMPPAMAMTPEPPEGVADKLERLRNRLLGTGFSNP